MLSQPSVILDPCCPNAVLALMVTAWHWKPAEACGQIQASDGVLSPSWEMNCAPGAMATMVAAGMLTTSAEEYALDDVFAAICGTWNNNVVLGFTPGSSHRKLRAVASLYFDWGGLRGCATPDLFSLA